MAVPYAISCGTVKGWQIITRDFSILFSIVVRLPTHRASPSGLDRFVGLKNEASCLPFLLLFLLSLLSLTVTSSRDLVPTVLETHIVSPLGPKPPHA